jgi:glutamate N-acetyltransferase/amino-acid N-acetyltransferase
MERIEGGHVTSAGGFRASGVTAGLKASGRPDLALLVSDAPATAAGVFTTNQVRAYNVDRSRSLLAAHHRLQVVLVNSGNANVATGAQGKRDTDRLAAIIGTELGCAADLVAVAQTGVIGVPLPMDLMAAGLPRLARELSPEGGPAAAEAICTTDTHLKQGAVRLDLGGVPVTIGAMAKGAGMIHPNMATMLCFVATDAALGHAALHNALVTAVDRTLNNLSIDGDQSTSDTCLILANGLAGGAAVTELDDPRLETFTAGLTAVLEPLAAAIARDGEGATKLLAVKVTGARTQLDARLAARSVASSNLVKCAVAGGDPNWGRIACAVGYSPAEVDQTRLTITVCQVLLLFGGEPVAFDAGAVRAAMAGPEVMVHVDLGLGHAEAMAFGCDLTEEYVRFNADYTT